MPPSQERVVVVRRLRASLVGGRGRLWNVPWLVSSNEMSNVDSRSVALISRRVAFEDEGE